MEKKRMSFRTVTIYKDDFREALDGYGPEEDASLFGCLLSQFGLNIEDHRDITEIEIEFIDYTLIK